MQDKSSKTDIVDIWRDPSNPKWQKVHDELFKIFRSEARKSYRIKRIHPADQEEQILALFHDFWGHCSRNRTVLTARAIYGMGAVRIEIQRFLASCTLDTEGSFIEKFDRLLRHLRAKKLLPLLKTDSHFAWFGGQYWGLESWKNKLPVDYFKGSDEELVKYLPTIPARLKEQREGQLPPLVNPEDLRAFLLEVFPIIGRARAVWDVALIILDRLEPSPISAFPHQDVSKTEEEKEYFITQSQIERNFESNTWQQEVDIVAGQIVDKMPQQEQQVFILSIEKVGQQEICERVGISRSTVHKLKKSYEDRLEKFATENEKTKEEVLFLIEAIRDILKFEAFGYSEE